MSRGDLQEMEVGTKQSRTAVNANAKAADAMPHLSGVTPGQTGDWEDLGGPDPTNYRPDDDSAKLKTPGQTLKQVKDVVNKGAKAAEAMKGVKEDEEFEYDEDEELLEAMHEEDDEEEGSKKKGKKKGSDEENEGDEGDEEEDDEMEEEFSIEEDVNALLDGEDLSEEFQEKARTIFEAAIRSKVY